MAGIASVYTSLLTQIKTDNRFKFVHIWNNQLEQLEDGDTYAFLFPNAFVEIIPPSSLALPLGYNVSDITIRIHIGHEEYDAGSGNFEENTNVFTYRDAIIKLLTKFKPTGCSQMMKVGEAQDFVHTNVYHYTVDFLCSFVDSIGSIDNDSTLVTKDPPTGLDLTIEIENSI